MTLQHHTSMTAPRPSTQAQQMPGNGVWAAQPRQKNDFEPLPVRTSILGLKTVEQDLQAQVKHIHDKVQGDLDLLHKQVLGEVYNSVAQELQAVAQRLGAQRSEIGAETEGLRAAVASLQQETKSLWSAHEQDTVRSMEALRQAVAKLSEETAAAMASEAATLRQETADLEARVLQAIVEVCDKVEKDGDNSNGEHQHKYEALQKAFAESLEERAEALRQRFESLESSMQELRDETVAEVGEREKLRDTFEQGQARAEAAVARLEETLRGQALVGEARFQESQAALASMEERHRGAIQDALSGASNQSQDKDLRVKYELETVKAGLQADFRERLSVQDRKMQQLNAECLKEVDFAMSGLARSVEWTAHIDAAALERDGRLEINGPEFSAAGLRPLQLQLRLAQEGRTHRWSCGAFLRTPGGRVSFRLSVLGRSQHFAAEFGEAREWGSHRLAILERVPAQLTVSLEIIDVAAPLPRAASGDSSLVVSSRIVDAAEAAAKETAALRASMVRRVEWRIAKVSERLAAAREAAGRIRGDEDALEPLLSPPFAAAGVAGLQLQLYPLGYRPRGEESCGFFLICPPGMYVKCRAFVGDAVRTFEHHYDTRESYGRGSFCRLGDKIDGEDCVVCGVEILEVRQEHTTQVRGGPFGNLADQLKVVTNPSVAGMEVVRELREIHSSDKKGGRRQNKAAEVAQKVAMRVTAPPVGAASQSLKESKSLPSLLPAVATMNLGGMNMSPRQKQVDAFKWRG